MTPEQIADERRRGRLAAGAAVVAAALSAAAAIWSNALGGDAPERNKPAELRYFDRHGGELIASWTLRGMALLLLLAVTVHLYRATKARRADEPQVVLVMGVYGPIAAGIGTIAAGIALALAASSFADREFQTIDAANDAIRTVTLIGLLSVSGYLALAFWFVKASLDAMRIGLLSRFMGIAGIMVGPGLLLISGLFQFLLPVWLLAIAALFSGLGLRGLPPAWEAGEAVVTPSTHELVGEALDDGIRTTPNGEIEAVGPGLRKPEAGDGSGSAPGRRKRKRRGIG
jgi:Domain of unknown function (DUF4386)